jgi:hypothetical protein
MYIAKAPSRSTWRCTCRLTSVEAVKLQFLQVHAVNSKQHQWQYNRKLCSQHTLHDWHMHLRLQGISEPVQQLLKGFYSANDPPTSYDLWGGYLLLPAAG